MPFLALLTRPVMGVSLTGRSPAGCMVANGLMGWPEGFIMPEDDDGPAWACEYAVGLSMESMLAVLWRRPVAGRLDEDVDDEPTAELLFTDLGALRLFPGAVLVLVLVLDSAGSR